MMQPAVFLDRDGVLNRALLHDGKPVPPRSLAELEVLDGVREALIELKASGYRLIVVTNQPDVARGTTTQAEVERINAALAAHLPLDAILTCYHDTADGCDCRKPKPGLVLRAARTFDIDLAASFMVGDRWRDIEAGRQAGVRTLFVDAGYPEPQPEHCDYRVASLVAASRIILAQPRSQARSLSELRVRIFADGADRATMLEMCARPYIRGVTTNPTLMRAAGVVDYRGFIRDIAREIRDKPLSFEVLSDDFREMEQQALEIAGVADNIYVKIPVTNTRGEPCCRTVQRLAARGVKVNVTAITTLGQVREAVQVLNPATPAYLSVFAGRIADTGIDPMPIMAQAVDMLRDSPATELIWASPREVLNVFQADAVGCHVITLTHDLLRKLALIGYDLERFSLDTVKMFYDDARAAGFSL